jgi:hypothetical protein
MQTNEQILQGIRNALVLWRESRTSDKDAVSDKEAIELVEKIMESHQPFTFGDLIAHLKEKHGESQ